MPITLSILFNKTIKLLTLDICFIKNNCEIVVWLRQLVEFTKDDLRIHPIPGLRPAILLPKMLL